jgi:hypothetical protein
MFLILVAAVKALLYPPFCSRTVRGYSTVSVLLIVCRSWSFDTTSFEERKQNTSWFAGIILAAEYHHGVLQ